MKFLFTIIFQYINIILLKFKNKIEGFNLSFFFLFFNKYFNIDLPEEEIQLFDFSYGIFLVAIVGLFSFISLLIAVLILYFKDKFNLELKFKNYPLIVHIIKYYEKSSYLNIIIQILFVLGALLGIIILTLLNMFRILNIST